MRKEPNEKVNAGRSGHQKQKKIREKKGIHKVAELASVSITTVSRVMNGAQNVDPKLSRRILKAIADTGYVPNRHAQALISGRTRLFGLLVPEITNPFFPELMRGFEEAALHKGFGVLIGATNGEAIRTEAWTSRMIEHGVEGLAIMTFMEEPASVYELAKNTPIVQVDVGQSINGVTTVPIDYESGIHQAVQHLAALGHRDIVFAAGPDHEFTPRARRIAFEHALKEIAVPIGEQSIYSEHHTLEGGIEAAKRILKRMKFPTAVLCSNDLMAIGMLRVFLGAGKSVPGDVSLIGLDDIHLAEFTMPALTTIRIPREELAEICFETLMRRLDRTLTQISVAGISTRLVVRGSTDFPRHAPGHLTRRSKALG